MPLRIRIDINGRDIATYWIGRLEGKAEFDALNTYVIGEETVKNLEPWNVVRIEELPKFTHRYGDGAEVCVAKGLEAWKEANDRTTTA